MSILRIFESTILDIIFEENPQIKGVWSRLQLRQRTLMDQRGRAQDVESSEEEEQDEEEQDMYKVLALNLGGVTTSAFFEERFFSSAGKVWNNGTFSLKPQSLRSRRS